MSWVTTYNANRDWNDRKKKKIKSEVCGQTLEGLLSKLCSCLGITHVREHTRNIAAFREAENGSSLRQQILATVRWHDFSCAFYCIFICSDQGSISHIWKHSFWKSSSAPLYRFARQVWTIQFGIKRLNVTACAAGSAAGTGISSRCYWKAKTGHMAFLWHKTWKYLLAKRGRLHCKPFLTNGFLSGMCTLRSFQPESSVSYSRGAYAPLSAPPPSSSRCHSTVTQGFEARFGRVAMPWQISHEGS